MTSCQTVKAPTTFGGFGAAPPEPPDDENNGGGDGDGNGEDDSNDRPSLAAVFWDDVFLFFGAITAILTLIFLKLQNLDAAWICLVTSLTSSTAWAVERIIMLLKNKD